MKPEPASPPAQASAAPPGGNGDGAGEPAGARPQTLPLNNLPGAVYRCRPDADWTVEFISEGCLDLTGYRAGELVGNRVTSLGAILHPGDVAAVREKRRADLAARKSCSSEYRITHRNGEVRWVWDQAQGICSESGELLHIEGLITDITERKRAEAAAREAARKLDSTIQNLPGFVYRCANTPDYRVEYISQGAMDVLGHPPEDFTSGRWKVADHLHPDDAERVWNEVQAAVAARRRFVVEYRIRHADGRERCLWEHGAGVFEGDRLVALEGFVTDITARKAAEAAVRASEEFNRGLVESSQDCIKSLDLEGKLLSMSPGGQRLMEIKDINRYLNSCWISLWHPDDQPRVRDAVKTAAGGGSGRFQAHCATEAGNPRWWDVIITPILGADGQVERLLSVSRDITAPHQTAAALRVSEERLRFVVEGTGTGLWDWDLATNHVRYSAEWKRMLGWSEHEVADHLDEWRRLTHPDDVEPTLKVVSLFLLDPVGSFETKFRMRHKDGRYLWILSRATAQTGADGKAVRLIGLHTDITAQKLAEQRQAAFAALGRRLNTATDDTAAARIIVDTADELFGWDSCKVDFYDAQTDRFRSILTVDAVNGQRQEFSPALSDTEPSPRLRQVVTTGALLILRQEPVTLSPDSTPFGDKSRPSASIMAVPIREAGKIVGVLAIQSYQVNAYTNADLAALQNLADHCAGALERIRSRADVERQHNELELILDTVPGIIFYKDRNHRLVRVNEAHARSLGLPRSAVEGHTDSELGSPYEEHYVRDDNEVMRTGQPKLGIVEPMHTSAGTRWLQTDKLPYRDAHGNIIGILGFALDITERKQAEEDLRRAEERYRSIFDHAVEGIYQSTPEGRYLTVNPAMAAIYGYASPEAMMREVTDIGRQLYADPADRRKLQALLHSQGGLGVFECQMRRRDGALIWIRQSSRAVRDASGRVSCYEGSAEDITARREAEEALRRQHALVTAVVEGTSDAVFAKDLEGRYLIINAAGAQALGRPAAEILGRTDAEFVPEATARRFREADEAVVASGQAQTQEETGVMAGVLRAWHAAKSPLRDAEGRIIGVIGVSRDITEQKQAEADRARLWSVLEASLNEIYVFDAQTLRFEYVNAAALRNLGYSAEAMRRLTPLDLKPQFTAATFAELVQPLRRHERAKVLFQTEHRRASGGRYPVEVHLQLVERGGRPAFLAVINDLTERRRAETALRESEENFQNLFEASPDAIIVATREGVIQTINRMTEQLFGYPRAELVGQAIELLMPARFRHGHVAQRENYIRDPRLRPMGEGRDLLARRKDGTEFPADISLSPIATAEGVMVISTIRDITKRKLAEAELVRLSGRLLRAQDEERRRLARELHDSTAQTFAALAMNLAVLGRGTPGLDAAGRALLVECESQVRRGTAELRTLAYLLHPPALEALGLTRAIHDYAEGFARRSGIQVELDVAELPERLPPDTELTLFRVLQESLGNLHRHSGSTTAAIRLAQDAETVVIEVRDTGCGLVESVLAAAQTGSARFGVGIAGMRERLRLLGGRLELEPALPGLRVRATLPLAADG